MTEEVSTPPRLGGNLSFTIPLSIALFVFLVAFYGYTLQPGLAWGDGAKLQMEAVTGASFIFADFPDELFAHDPYPFARLGVAAWDHPLYVVLAHTLVRALPGLSALWLVNLLSALFGAGAIVIFFQLSYVNTQSLAASLLAALTLAVSHTFWWHSSTPEVYTLFAFLLLMSLFFYDRYEKSKRFLFLVLSSFFFGLAAATHILAFLAFPAISLYWLFAKKQRPTEAATFNRLAVLGLAFALGLAVLLIQLVRMLRIFPLGEVAGPVVGSVFLSALLSTTPLALLDSLLAYLQYLIAQFGPLALVLGLYALLKGWQENRHFWRKALAFYAVYSLFGIFYRVTDQFAFFLTSHIFMALLIAIGTAQVTKRISQRGRMWLYAGLAAYVLAAPFIYAALPPLAGRLGITDEFIGVPQIGTGLRDGLAYYVNPNKHGDDQPYRFGLETLNAMPPNAFIVAQWYLDTDEYLILRYLTTVDAVRPDVKVAGWTLVDPFNFESTLVLSEVKAQLPLRPVFLASLDEEYYQSDVLLEEYCIVPEANLYRIYPRTATDPAGQDLECLTAP